MITNKIFFIFFFLILPHFCLAQEMAASDILKKAEQNIEKHRKSDAFLSFLDTNGNPVKDAEIEVIQLSQDFLFGNIIFPVVGVLGKFEDIDVYHPELFKRRFKDLFNMAIFPFYWASYEREAGKEKWDRIDPILNWCELNGITPKGHPLAWVERSGTPTWLYDLPIETTEDLLKARIIRIAKGYKGRINIWDVVNEPTHTVNWQTMMKNPHVMRYKSAPIDEIADWIEKCYRWAHEANPEAELVINEYETIVSDFILDTKERFYALIAELKRRGTPLHGVGLQAHEPRSEWYSPVEYWKVLDYYSELGLPLHLTEFVSESSNEKIKGWKEGNWGLEEQADFAEQFYRISFGHPMVESINWWGLSDRYIWQERPQAGLIDENYNPKPVYNRLRQLIKNEWMTNTSGSLNKDGLFSFRGFHGTYQIILKTSDNQVHTFNIHLSKDEKNEWVFNL
jgi:GH35 family endo-1,4-beta-xylanase